MHRFHRRSLLKLAGAGATLAWMPGAARLLAQGRSPDNGGATPTLVCIYLRGGMDALNAVVPHGDPLYYEMRPTIAVERPGAEAGALPIDSMFGLHPSMRALLPLWEAGRLAAVINCGSPHPTRSHFDAQDFMEYGAPGVRTIKEGWLNRYLQATRAAAERRRKDGGVMLRAMAMQGLLPRALRGEFPVLAVPERRVLDNERVMDLFEDVYGAPDTMGGEMGGAAEGDAVLEVGRDTLEILSLYRRTLAENRGDRQVEYPRGAFGQRLADIAAIVHANVHLEVACVDVLGWDHHANQGGEGGTYAGMLATLGDSLAAFTEDLGEHFDRTLVLVATEFGRTCRENGNAGTDHGRGGTMFLLGGAVRGGKLHGKWAGLADRDLVDGRDLPVTTDYRDLFADVLAHHLGFEAPKGFFPDHTPRPVPGLF